MTVGILSFGHPFSVFNNGKSQINFNNVQSGSGEFPFMNVMKTANINSTLTPDNCDTNGCPTTGGGGWATSIPSQNERAGSYYLRWIGTGVASIGITGGITLNSGSLTPSAGVGFAEFTPVSATAGPTANAITIGFNNPAQNITLCHHSDDVAVALNPNEFHPQFMAVMRALNCGVLRFLNWFNGDINSVTTWASRAPTTYVTFSGTPMEKNNYGGADTLNGTDVSVSTPPGGFVLQDKARLQYFIANTMPSIVNSGKTGTFTSTQTNVTVTAHGLATGNQIYLGGATIPTPFSGIIGSVLGGATNAQVQTYFVTVIDANTITLSATSGGSAITCTGSGTCTVFGYVTISVGGGAKTPMFNGNFYPYPQGFLGYPSANTTTSTRVLVYDATFGAFCNLFSTSGGTSVPPEVCLDLCYKLGAHPWFAIPPFACDPATDLVPQLGAFIRDTYQNGKAPWMVPRLETPNELFNTNLGGGDAQYASRKAGYYGWGSIFDWEGKVGSILGQACANVWGFGTKGVKYHSIMGVNTSTGTDQNFGTGLYKNCFSSTQFMTNDPNTVQSPYTRSPAFVWCSHLAAASYVAPSANTENQIVTLGFAYTVTNAANPTAQLQNVADYVDTLAGSALHINNAAVINFFTNWAAFGQGVTQGQTLWTFNAINYTFGIDPYEGGYSPDYVGGGVVSTLSGAVVTSGTTVDLTLSYTSIQTNNLRSGNPAVAGMFLKMANVIGMTQLNGNTYQVAAVSGNTVTITVPSTAGFGTFPTSTTTLTIASPGNVNWTAHGLSIGNQVIFSTTGALPTGLIAGTIYFVKTVIDPDNFTVSATNGGAVINFTGSQSGAQSASRAINSAASYFQDSGATISADVWIQNMRGQGKLCTTSTLKPANGLGGHLTDLYNGLAAIGVSFPSCFMLGDVAPPPSNDVWSIMNDIYQCGSPPVFSSGIPSPQALAIQVYNN